MPIYKDGVFVSDLEYRNTNLTKVIIDGTKVYEKFNMTTYSQNDGRGNTGNKKIYVSTSAINKREIFTNGSGAVIPIIDGDIVRIDVKEFLSYDKDTDVPDFGFYYYDKDYGDTYVDIRNRTANGWEFVADKSFYLCASWATWNNGIPKSAVNIAARSNKRYPWEEMPHANLDVKNLRVY